MVSVLQSLDTRMRLLLLLGLLFFTYAAEQGENSFTFYIVLMCWCYVGNVLFFLSESCIERCENGFDATKNCQCDSMCTYYKSCCTDYESFCRIRSKFTIFHKHVIKTDA